VPAGSRHFHVSVSWRKQGEPGDRVAEDDDEAAEDAAWEVSLRVLPVHGHDEAGAMRGVVALLLAFLARVRLCSGHVCRHASTAPREAPGGGRAEAGLDTTAVLLGAAALDAAIERLEAAGDARDERELVEAILGACGARPVHAVPQTSHPIS
jgi:hypothetical protein